MSNDIITYTEHKVFENCIAFYVDLNLQKYVKRLYIVKHLIMPELILSNCHSRINSACFGIKGFSTALVRAPSSYLKAFPKHHL